MNKEEIIKSIRSSATTQGKQMQEYFGIKNTLSFGLTMPQMRAIAKQNSENQELAFELWETGIHEARHIAIMISDHRLLSEGQMEKWLKDFNSWDLVDNCCSTLFRKSPLAYKKAREWSGREKEFERRAGFSMMAVLAVHDKNESDKSFEAFYPYIINASDDPRNFVRKAVNWALRQIGKRNVALCHSAIVTAELIKQKKNSTSKWIAADALRELNKYLAEGKIKNVGK